MDTLIQISQFILSLSLLIVLHEMGHFIPARLFKTRVEKFYLFFDPWFSLVKKKIGDTEYGIGWLPLGGYVKISGMVDESMDTKQLSEEPKPWEFRSKKPWQRLIIMLGGVTVNVIVAFVIYAGVLAYWGEEYLPTANLKYGITVDDGAWAMGLRDGDKILRVNGMEVDNFAAIPLEILLNEDGQLLVERDGSKITVPYGDEDVKALIKSQGSFLGVRMPYVAASFTDSSAAAAAGMKEGDSLVAFNGRPMAFLDQYLDSIPKYASKPIVLTAMRNGDSLNFAFDVPSYGMIGVYWVGPKNFFSTSTREYSLLEAIPAAVAKSGSVLSNYVRQFKVIFNPRTEAYKEVGGFDTIRRQFSTEWNWYRFWNFTAFLSIMLAFLNVLPIPALDGGHVMFTLWEMISGKPAPQKVLEYAQLVGFILLLALIVLANGNDVLRALR
jgi:regulator of sigma E protease